MRTDYCGNINEKYLGKEIILYGWVNKKRNLGNLIFIDIRDREGIVQICFIKKNKKIFKLASTLKNEFCIQIIGIVKKREKKNINKKISTGNLEVLANNIIILNPANSIPIDFNKTNSETKLKYRYLHLRNPKMIFYLKTRSKITSFIRKYMEKNSFLNIETPILTKSSPEGARDYLVPSRIHKEKFYALPQSPQIFKQLLMISGFDRYYQIAKCFRDEDLRTDRQPEFTQIDIEASFIKSIEIRNIVEKLIKKIWLNFLNINLNSFPVLTYSDAIKKYGSDKPDLRNPILLNDITNILKKNNFYSKLLKNYNIAIALVLEKGSTLNIKEIKKYIHFLKEEKLKSFYIKVFSKEKGLKGIESSFLNINNTLLNLLVNKIHLKNGDLIFFSIGSVEIVRNKMSMLRTQLGIDMKLLKKNWAPIWITDFPLFTKDLEGNLKSLRHPFTLPKNSLINETNLNSNTMKYISDSYDLVINGYEIGSGSSRIYTRKMQEKVFDLLKISKKEQYDKYEFLLNALEYGAPPHAGIACGLDRITMLITNTNNIRDVIAFPKTTSGSCLMSGTPGKIYKDF